MPCHCARIASCHSACHSVPCHFVSFRVISCHFVSFRVIRINSGYFVSLRVISCHFVIVCLSARLGQICHCHCVPFGTSWSDLSLSLHAPWQCHCMPLGTPWSGLSSSAAICHWCVGRWCSDAAVCCLCSCCGRVAPGRHRVVVRSCCLCSCCGRVALGRHRAVVRTRPPPWSRIARCSSLPSELPQELSSPELSLSSSELPPPELRPVVASRRRPANIGHHRRRHQPGALSAGPKTC